MGCCASRRADTGAAPGGPRAGHSTAKRPSTLDIVVPSHDTLHHDDHEATTAAPSDPRPVGPFQPHHSKPESKKNDFDNHPYYESNGGIVVQVEGDLSCSQENVAPSSGSLGGSPAVGKGRSRTLSDSNSRGEQLHSQSDLSTKQAAGVETARPVQQETVRVSPVCKIGCARFTIYMCVVSPSSVLRLPVAFTLLLGR